MKILLADDHPLFREGVRHVLAQLAHSVQILDAHDYPRLFSLAAAHPDLDLALADLNMPGMAGHEGIVRFRDCFPCIPLVVLTASESHADAQQALASGAMGFIRKSLSSQNILDALRRVLGGEIYVAPGMPGAELPGHAGAETAPAAGKLLTARQLEVLRLLLQGRSNKAIAGELQVSEGTIKIHVTCIFRALKVSSRMEAYLAARQLGLLEDAVPPPV